MLIQPALEDGPIYGLVYGPVYGSIYGPEMLIRPVLQAGDAILFSEGTMHGAMPWSGSGEGLFALFRYGPAHHGYGRGYLEGWPEEMLSELTEEE